MNEHPETNPPPNFKTGGWTCSLLSVVIPCFNEEEVLPKTHPRLVGVLEAIPVHAFELIYVDDGSRDTTMDILREIQRADTRVRVVSLSRNFGQEMAMTAGLQSAAGQAVVLIDADFQDPPEVIIKMLDRWRQGVDVAYGVRTQRDGETLFKNKTASLFYRIFNCLADIDIPLDTGEFRLMDRAVVDAILAMPEHDRFLRGIVAWAGFRQEPIYFHRLARPSGASKHRLKNRLSLAATAILSFSLAPLRLATWLGLFSTGLALSGTLYALGLRFLTDLWISGWASLFIAVLFLGGVQLVLLGVLGEYVGRIYGEVKRRPLYLVKERLGFTSTSQSANSPHSDEIGRVHRRRACR